MRCPDKGKWQAFVDGELCGYERERLVHHLGVCKACSERLGDMQNRSAWVASHLEALMRPTAPTSEGLERRLERAHHKISERMRHGNWQGGVTTMRKRPAYSALLVAGMLCVMVVALSFSPVRGALAGFIGWFRVRDVRAVEFTIEDIEAIKRQLDAVEGEIALDLKQFGSLTVSRAAGLKEIRFLDEIMDYVRIPEWLPAGVEFQHGTQEDVTTVAFRLNVDAINRLCRLLGGAASLPELVDGKEFTIKFGPSFHLFYAPTIFDAGRAEPVVDINRYMSINVVANPEMKIPAGVDPAELRKAVLDLPFLPWGLRQQLAQIQSWESTLPVPYLREDCATEYVDLNGTTGLLITDKQPNLQAQRHTLIWISDGSFYQIDGTGLTVSEIIQVARGMR